MSSPRPSNPTASDITSFMVVMSLLAANHMKEKNNLKAEEKAEFLSDQKNPKNIATTPNLSDLALREIGTVGATAPLFFYSTFGNVISPIPDAMPPSQGIASTPNVVSPLQGDEPPGGPSVR